jgi:threonine dehydrogenase-like Zn-dependent dehydrogenase/predicted NBD/HSP70 family sugar kinase
VSDTIVADVGGTTTRLARWPDGDAVRFRSPAGVRDEFVDSLAARLRRLAPSPARVGVALGAVVTGEGVVHNASTLWREPATGYDFAGALRERLPRTAVSVLNDVTAAGWHYRQLERFVLVTVSTGVAIKAFDGRPVLDPDGLGGESGHVPVAPVTVPTDLGRRAAAGDETARAELADLGQPWCECGAVADLCSYASGPAVGRAAQGVARSQPDRFASSHLSTLAGAAPAGPIGTRAIAAAAKRGDPLTLEILRWSTRPLALRLLQVCADLGMRKVVVLGGFAHGVGEPWTEALHGNLRALMVRAGWYTTWSAAELRALVHLPGDAEVAPLHGIGAYLDHRSRRYRAAVKPVASGRLVLRERDRPACGAEQFLLRPRYVGICATDLQILGGQRGCEPDIPGHECVAEVVEVGEGITGLRAGELVTLNPNNPLDDHDKLGHNRPGVLTELMVCDAALVARGQVVRVPADAGPEHTLAEPLAAVVRAQELLADHAPGKVVLVVGTGVVGLLHVMLARARGAGTVLLAGGAAVRLARAVELGLVSPRETVLLATDPGDGAPGPTPELPAAPDTVVIAAGAGRGMGAAGAVWQLLAPAAAVHLFGGFATADRLAMPGEPVAVGPLRAAAGSVHGRSPAGGEVVLTGSRGGERVHIERAVALVRELDVRPLVSHLVRFPDAPHTMAELVRDRTIGGQPTLRVVVMLDDGARHGR